MRPAVRPPRRASLGAACTVSVLALAALLTACGSPGGQPAATHTAPATAASSAPAARASSTAKPSGQAAARTSKQVPLGVYQPGELLSWNAVAEFSRQAGQQVQYVVSYTDPAEPFPSQLAEQAAAHGAKVIIQLEPKLSIARVIAGDDDAYLSSLAAQIANFGRPVIVSWAAEANGNWYGYGYTHTPAAEYLASWAHVMKVFSGVSNVTWMETLNRVYDGSGPISDYFVPGVDMYGINAYYSYSNDTFESVFGETIRQIRALTSKPLLINETAIGQQNSQAGSIPGLIAGVRASGLAGFVYFNENQGTGQYHQNWALSGASFSVLRASLASAAARG